LSPNRHTASALGHDIGHGRDRGALRLLDGRSNREARWIETGKCGKEVLTWIPGTAAGLYGRVSWGRRAQGHTIAKPAEARSSKTPQDRAKPGFSWRKTCITSSNLCINYACDMRNYHSSEDLRLKSSSDYSCGMRNCKRGNELVRKAEFRG
jgi:hypothetical protein